jgi:hypothetical protein
VLQSAEPTNVLVPDASVVSILACLLSLCAGKQTMKRTGVLNMSDMSRNP